MKIIGIAGGSGSGKSTIATRIGQLLGSALVITTDDFYHTRPPHLARKKYNFDLPEALDFAAIVETLFELQAERSATIPVYDFMSSSRISERKISPQNWIFVEGLHTFYDPQVTKIFDLKIFIETSPEVMLARRLLRDLGERGRKPKDIVEQFFRDVLPAYRAHVLPLKSEADIIIENDFRSNIDKLAVELVRRVVVERDGK